MNNDFPIIRLIAEWSALAAAMLAALFVVLMACQVIGPAWVLLPLTVLAFAWALA
jgi:hypothetical protein